MAGVGPLTSSLEAGATTIAAGVVVGGFLASVIGMVAGWSAAKDRAAAVRAGHMGGGFALLFLVADLLLG